MRLDEHRAVGIELVGDDKEVFCPQPVGTNRDLVGRLLLREVAVLACDHRPEVLVAARDCQASAKLLCVRRALLLAAEVGERVVAHLERLALRKLPLARGPEAADPDSADQEEDDRRMDDVAAVAATVPPDEAREG